MQILISSLGMNDIIAAETLCMCRQSIDPFLQHHPHARDLDIDEYWLLVTTGGLKAARDFQQWVGQRLQVRIWHLEADDIDTPERAEEARELVYRALLAANEQAPGQVIVSLTGARKTFGSDLQEAGRLLGCREFLHVIDFHGKQVKSSTEPLQDLSALSAVWMEGSRPSPLLLHDPPILRQDYPLGREGPWRPDQRLLWKELHERRRQAAGLAENFIKDLQEREPYPNWQSLYRLSPKKVKELREARVTQDDLDWLKALPKAELHCHLGGYLEVADQQEVARAIWPSLPEPLRQTAQAVAKRWNQEGWPVDWAQQLKAKPEERTALVCALLKESTQEKLTEQLWPGWPEQGTVPFEIYERAGDLSGSALLGNLEGLETYVRCLLARAAQAGLSYLELRANFAKYSPDPIHYLSRLREYFEAHRGELIVRVLWIVDRRDRLKETLIQQIVRAADEHQGWLVGIDLAGDETMAAAAEFAQKFEPFFERSLPITIHAGETESAKSIWEAAYRLHADRIGHGLKLKDNVELAHRFRERKICVELCPSSNRQIVGFAEEGDYPLKTYMEMGLPVTVCTDNPGISRTNLNQEYVVASQLTPGGLTRWQVLSLIYSAFRRAFLPADEKARLLRETDHKIFQLLNPPE